MNIVVEKNKSDNHTDRNDSKGPYERVSILQHKIQKSMLKIISEQDMDQDLYLYKYLELYLHAYKNENNLAKSTKRDSKYVAYIKGHVRKYYMEDIALSRLAEDLHINSNYLSRLFKEETGTNFMRYLLEYRIIIAKELMRDRAASVSDISVKVGYKDPCYFSRVFKNISGKSPSVFLRQMSKL